MAPSRLIEGDRTVVVTDLLLKLSVDLSRSGTDMRVSVLLLVITLLPGCGGSNPMSHPKDHTGLVALDQQASRDSDRKALLEVVIRDLMTDPKHRQAIDSYGVPEAREYALAIDSKVPWPESFVPSVPGYTAHLVRTKDLSLDVRKPALTCIELRKFEFDPNRDKTDDNPLSGPIELGIFTVRGSKGGGAIGGCTVWYDYRRVAGKWEVVFAGELDP